MAVNPSIQLGTSGNWAIKEDNLLAYKQLGNKFFDREFDFSRGTRATFVGRNGLIQESGLTSAELVTNGDFSQEGPELVTNGDFATDSGWSKGTGWSISGGAASCDGTQTGNTNLRSTFFNFSVDTKVTLSFDVINYSAGDLAAGVTGTGQADLTGINANGTYSVTVVSSAGSRQVDIVAKSDFIGSIDNVSVKEVGQDWTLSSEVTIQNNSATFTLAPSGQQAAQAISSVVGKKYKIIYEIKSITQGAFDVSIGGSISANYNNNVGIYTEYLTATTTSGFYVRSRGTASGSITNISVKEIQTDVPRIDFTDDPTGHLLLEPQSTNLITQSELFSGGSWGNYNSTITDNQTTAPDGLLTASKFSGTSDVTPHTLYLNAYPVVSGNDYTYSVFAKKNENNFIQINTGQGFSNLYANFDLDNGVVGSFNTLDANIKPYLNGWFKCSVKANSSTATGQSTFSLIQSLTDVRNPSFNALNNSVYIWGAQLEQQSYATSYIPTSGSAVTRNQELCNNSGTVNDFNSEEGVLYAEIAALADDLTNRFISLTDGTQNNSVCLFYGGGSSNFIRSEIKSNNVTQAELTTTSYPITNFNKIAVKYKGNDFALWVNGVEVATDTSGSTPIGLNDLSFNRANILDFYGKTKNLKAFKRALTDAELYLLTVTQYQSYQEMATALNYTL